ncbi:MAG: hypothetical protein KJO26_04755, partial [Deltaproteobacteria bacterium]|nr:hypothetical protein [Deltaproteobacteria bacterium]
GGSAVTHLNDLFTLIGFIAFRARQMRNIHFLSSIIRSFIDALAADKNATTTAGDVGQGNSIRGHGLVGILDVMVDSR